MSWSGCVVGLDVSPTKIGVGVVDAEGEPLFATYRPIAKGDPDDVRAALLDIDSRIRALEAEVTDLVIERPFGARGDVDGAAETGVTIGMVTYGARILWPWVMPGRIETTTWRSAVGIPVRAPREIVGHNVRRAWLKHRAVERAQALGFDLPIVGVRKRRPSDDAAEGACIARAVWLRSRQEAAA